MKNRLLGPSEISALDFKHKFEHPQFARFQRLSMTIGRFFEISADYGVADSFKKDRQPRFKTSPHSQAERL
jgi:hypothetical protein